MRYPAFEDSRQLAAGSFNINKKATYW